LTSDTEVIGKESLNLVVCIAELYNLEAVSCILIYDIIRELLREGMGELEVELLLKILRSAYTLLSQLILLKSFCSLGSAAATR